jgi:hypothetical protein
MPLQPPKKTTAGYFMALQPPVLAPALHWDTAGSWIHTSEWADWGELQRKTLLGEILSHGTWFSRPPRHDIIDPLFSPWSVKQGTSTRFYCKTPDIPGQEGSSGVGTWSCQGVVMTSTSIYPVWKIEEFSQDEMMDTISLFGDGETVDGDLDLDGDEKNEETREIQIEELEDASPAVTTRIRPRDWDARKFMFKERVREARLKAQVAAHLAYKEEARFFREFGDLEDNESRFSDYDLSSESSDSASDTEDGRI